MAKAIKKDGLTKGKDKLKVPGGRRRGQPIKTKDELFDALSDRERIFCDNYLIVPNKTKAALAAGVSASCAAQNGYEIYNRPHVKAYLDSQTLSRKASTDEIIQLTADIAYSNATDYLSEIIVEERPLIEVGLQFIIDQKKEELDIYKEVQSYKQRDKKQEQRYQETLESFADEILELEIILRRNPNAKRIIRDTPRLVPKLVVDLKKVKEDKIHGKVKKIKEGQYGIEFELYDATAAHDKLLKIGGAFSKDNEQKAVNVSVNLTKDQVQEIAKGLEDKY